MPGHMGTHRVSSQAETEAFLASGKAFGDPHEPPKRIETHGAVVFLSGDTVLKLKKAVRFPFLDLSTVEKRHHACEQELSVNRRFAPHIYRAVRPIRRIGRELVVGGDRGDIVDWVVDMRRFDESATFDRLAAAGALGGPQIDAMAAAIAASHDSAPRREADDFLRMIETTLDQNLCAFAEFPGLFMPARVNGLDTRLRRHLDAARPAIQRRGAAGFVRRCHGDLHLRNIALVDGKPTLFDALEFDDTLASGDVLYDLAFVLMDLWIRGFKGEANRLFNGYLVATHRDDDLSALAQLPLYLAVRATIRAKVTAASAASRTGAEARSIDAEALAYFDAAENFAQPAPPRFVAIGGLSGTGKTTLARNLAAGLGPAPGAVHLRSDVERKILFGVAPTDPLPPNAYEPEVSKTVFKTIHDKAMAALTAGHGVIVDGVYASTAERHAAERVAIGASVHFDGIFLEAPLGVRLARVETRVGDASDARAAVALAQEQYDIGPHRWTVVDAAGDFAETAANARTVLGVPF